MNLPLTDKFTAVQKRDAALRELKMRERVYPRWVSNRRMSQAKADEELALMREIAGDYEQLIELNRLI